MDDRQVEKLEKHVGQLRDVLRELNDKLSLDEFMTIIHRPGWTTIAEWNLVEGGLQSMIAMATALNDLKLSILAGARAVGRENTDQ